MAEEYAAAQAEMQAKKQAEIDAAAAKKGDGMLNKLNVLFQDGDEFLAKWSGPMILGPLVPCMFAVFIIVSGPNQLAVVEGKCNFALDAFVIAAIVISYLFLLIYSWLWLGDELRFEVEFLRINKVILRPFASMKWLMAYYVVIFFTAMIIFAAGTSLLSAAELCAVSTPRLYSYVTFLIAVFWIMFVVIVVFVIGQAFGSSIAKFVAEKTAAPSQSELEERLFRKTFNDFDRDNASEVDVDMLSPILGQLGMFVPEEELPALKKTLDPDDTGKITFDNMLAWFIKFNTEAGDGEEIDEDEDDAFDDFSFRKAK